jgi:hypothetical protein
MLKRRVAGNCIWALCRQDIPPTADFTAAECARSAYCVPVFTSSNRTLLATGATAVARTARKATRRGAQVPSVHSWRLAERKDKCPQPARHNNCMQRAQGQCSKRPCPRALRQCVRDRSPTMHCKYAPPTVNRAPVPPPSSYRPGTQLKPMYVPMMSVWAPVIAPLVVASSASGGWARVPEVFCVWVTATPNNAPCSPALRSTGVRR